MFHFFPFPLHALFTCFHQTQQQLSKKQAFRNTIFSQADKKPEHEPNENYCLGVCLHDSAGNHGNSHSSHPKNSCSAKDNCKDQLSPDFHAWSSAFCTSTGTALTDFTQTEKLMSSQVISFGLPLYTFVMLLPVFIFLAEGTRFQITFP